MDNPFFVYKFELYELEPYDDGMWLCTCPKCKEQAALSPEFHEVEFDENNAVTITPSIVCPFCGHTIWVEKSLGVDA